MSLFIGISLIIGKLIGHRLIVGKFPCIVFVHETCYPSGMAKHMGKHKLAVADGTLSAASLFHWSAIKDVLHSGI